MKIFSSLCKAQKQSGWGHDADPTNLSERFEVREIAHDPWKNLPLITSR
jgi:hypothetical protein